MSQCFLFHKLQILNNFPRATVTTDDGEKVESVAIKSCFDATASSYKNCDDVKPLLKGWSGTCESGFS